MQHSCVLLRHAHLTQRAMRRPRTQNSRTLARMCGLIAHRMPACKQERAWLCLYRSYGYANFRIVHLAEFPLTPNYTLHTYLALQRQQVTIFSLTYRHLKERNVGQRRKWTTALLLLRIGHQITCRQSCVVEKMIGRAAYFAQNHSCNHAVLVLLLLLAMRSTATLAPGKKCPDGCSKFGTCNMEFGRCVRPDAKSERRRSCCAAGKPGLCPQPTATQPVHSCTGHLASPALLQFTYGAGVTVCAI